MRVSEIVYSSIKPGKAEKWLRVVIAVAVFISVTFMGSVALANAGGVTQISGESTFADPGDCTDPVTGANGQAPDFAFNLTGDLSGCRYVFVETAECTPSGVYLETGTDIYVGSGREGDDGTFRTTYRFEAKYADCGNLIGEVHGRCQHQVILGTGTGDYEGASGQLEMSDQIAGDVITISYKGHLRW